MIAPKRPHVVIFAFPFGTHAAPLLSLCRHLAASSPGASFSFFTTPKSNESLASTVAAWGPLSNLRICDLWDGVPPADNGSARTQEENIELFLKATPGNLKEALRRTVEEEEEAGEATCVVSDAFLWSAGEMAEEMGVPWVALWTSGAASLAAHSFTDLLRCTFGTGEDAEKRQEEVVDILPGFSALRISDLPDGVVLGPLHSPFSLLLHRVGLSLPRASAVAVNTVHHLDSTILRHLQTTFRTCLTVGPLSLLSPPPTTTPDLDAAADECLAWLDHFSPASVAYVGFGSFLTPPPAELAALAVGLEASGAPFVWSLKEKAWEGLPSGFLARVKGRGQVVPWAPQVEVLSHAAVGVFVTHCGWNSVMESVSGGVPMICRPFFGDQKLNARLVSEVWKIGVGVEGVVLSEDGVAAAVDVVLRKEEGRGMRERAGGLREVAKQAVAHGGSSRKGLDALLQIITTPDTKPSLAS